MMVRRLCGYMVKGIGNSQQPKFKVQSSEPKAQNKKKALQKTLKGYGIGRRPTLPPVGQYHRRGRA